MVIRSIMLSALLTLALAPAAFAAGDTCSYNGNSFSEGSTTCQSGTQFRCDDGEWESLSIACSGKDPSKACDYNGTSYSTGSASCQAGMQFRCENGTWKTLALACPPDVAAAPRPAPKTCMLEGGSTVSTASTVCRSGSMYMCDDGEWRNLGTPCK